MSRTRLYVITAVSRPQNLLLLEESLHLCDPYFQVVWLKTDQPSYDPYGNDKKSILLDQVEQSPGHWVRFLDDDNLIHPAYPEAAFRAVQKNTTDLFLFRQVWGNGKFKLLGDPPSVHNGRMDTDQMLIRASSIKQVRWKHGLYNSDYWFAHDLKAAGAKVEIVDEIASWYNKLRV